MPHQPVVSSVIGTAEKHVAVWGHDPPISGPLFCEVAIDNSGGGALTDYQVRVEVEYVSGMRNDFNDIRFYDSDDETALDHWREYFFSRDIAIFWVKVPSIDAASTKTIYMYYGTETTSASDDVATMMTGSDFDDGTTTGWTINTAGAGSATVPAVVGSEWVYGYRIDDWHKFTDQPIIALGAGGTWDDNQVRDLGIIISDEDGMPVKEPGTHKLVGYYSGYDGAEWATGIAKSTDNGFTWSDRSRVIQPSGGVGSWYRTDIFQPSVIQRQSDGLYLMMAHGKDTVAGTHGLGVFTSSDGITWSDGGKMLALTDFSWDGGTGIDIFGAPSCIKRSSGDYLMLFEGRKTGGVNDWAIFGATSNDFTGSWSAMNGGLPIFGPTGAGWEQNGVANPSIIEADDSQYILAYNGIGGAAQWQIGFASSADLSAWTRYASNPVLTVGSGWEQTHVEVSGLVKGESSWLRLFYQGFNALVNPQIGVAITDQTRYLDCVSAANADGWIVGVDMDGITEFIFEGLMVEDENGPGTGSTIYTGLIDSAAVPSPNTVAALNALRRFTINREEPNSATNPSGFSIQYRTGAATFQHWNGAAWQAGASYHGGPGIYKIRIWDDGTNYVADIQDWQSGTSIFAAPASIAKATVASFANGRVLFTGEIFTDAYYMGQDYENMIVREYTATEPSTAVTC